MKVYGIGAGYQQYGSGDIFEAKAYKDSTKEEGEQAQDLGGEWIDVLGMFFINSDGEPQMTEFKQYIQVIE